MAFTIKDRDEAVSEDPQSIWMQSDIDAIIAGIGTTYVVSGCGVSAQGTPDMSVAVAAGSVVSEGNPFSVSADTVVIAAAESDPRVDMIVVDSSGALAVREGVSDPHPKMEALLDGDVFLAAVYVPGSATSVINGHITDKRVIKSVTSLNDTDDLPEGTTNLYWTNSRFDTRLGLKTTADLTEGANLYYTNTRADARVVLGIAAHVAAVDPHTQYHTDARALTWLGGRSTSDLPEGTNLYWTNSRFDTRFDTRLATKSTSDLPEGSNEYYTNAKVSAVISGLGLTSDHGGLSGLGDDDHTQYHNNARALTWLGTRSTSDLPEGSNEYYTQVKADARVAAGIATHVAASDPHTGYLLLAGRSPGQTVTDYVTISPASHVPANGVDEQVFTVSTTWTPSGQGVFRRSLFYAVGAVKPTADDTGDYRAFEFLLDHDSGVFALSTMRGVLINVRKLVAGSLNSMQGVSIGLTASAGTLNTMQGFRSAVTLTGATSISSVNHFDIVVNSLPTALTAHRGINIPNLGGSGVTTAVGVEIAAQTGATSNFGIRNASNLVQTGYARFGAVTAPTNVTSGDVTATRALLGSDTAFVESASLFVSPASITPAATVSTVLISPIYTPNGGNFSTSALAGAALVRPSAADTGQMRGLNYSVWHDSGAFNTGQIFGALITVLKSVGSSTSTSLIGVQSGVSVSAGTATLGAGYRSVLVGSGGTITTMTHYDVVVTSLATTTTHVGLNIPNLGGATVTTAVGIDLAAQSGATTNFAIRNAGNSVQTGYARFGAVTAPNAVTAGDVTAIRLNLGNVAFGTATEVMSVNTTLVATSGSENAVRLNTTMTPASNSTASMYALRSTSFTSGSSDQGTIVVLQFVHTHRGTGAVTAIRGIDASPMWLDSGTAMGAVTAVDGIFIGGFFRTAAQTVTVTTWNGLRVQGPATAGQTITTMRGLFVEAHANAVVTTFVALDIGASTLATTNIGIRNPMTTVLTPSTAQNITAVSATILANASLVQLTADASYTLTSTPTIADGQNGQVLTIMNVDTTDTITLQDQAVLGSSNLRLLRPTIVLKPRASVTLVYSSTVGDWIQEQNVIEPRTSVYRLVSAPGNADQTINVNNTSYAGIRALQHSVNFDISRATHFRIVMYGATNEAAQTVTLELISDIGTGTTVVHTGGDDLAVTGNTNANFDSGWRTIDVTLSAFNNTMSLAVKGSNGTVDLVHRFIEIHYKYDP